MTRKRSPRKSHSKSPEDELVTKTTGLSLTKDVDLITFAKKLGPGTQGKEVSLITNCFQMKTNERSAYKYTFGGEEADKKKPTASCSRQEDTKCGIQTRNIPVRGNGSSQDPTQASYWKDIQAKLVRASVFQAMRKKVDMFKKVPAVFDGVDSFYTIGSPLQTSSEPMSVEFIAALEGGEGEKMFKVTFKPAMDRNTGRQKVVDLQDDVDSEAIAVKQLSINYMLSKQPHTITKGASQYKLNTAKYLGENLELLKGFKSTVRVGTAGGNKPQNMLVADMAASLFEKGGLMIDILTKLAREEAGRREPTPLNRMVPLTVKDLLSDLKGLKVEFAAQDKIGSNFKRKLKIEGFSDRNVKETTFTLEGKTISVYDYFARERHPKFILKYPNLPCFSNKRKLSDRTTSETYTPVEICTLIPNQHYDKKLSMEIQGMVTKDTVTPPQPRFNGIVNEVKALAKGGNELVKLDISVEPIETKGRVLDPPSVKFQGPRAEILDLVPKDRWSNPCDYGKDRSLKLNNPATLRKWKVIQLAYPYDRDEQLDPRVFGIAKELVQTGQARGMTISPPDIHKTKIRSLGINELKREMEIFKKNGFEMVLVVLPEKDKLYNDIKAACNEVGIISQCVQLSNLKRTLRDGRPMPLADNIIKKMNPKLGGVNAALDLSSINKDLFPPVTMVCGMDVYHPGVGEGIKASIIGILASYNRDTTKYLSHAFCQPQPNGTFKRKEEVEEGLDEVMINFFKKFHSVNKMYPQHIIFFRDGVSEGQLEKVVSKEVKQILDAMATVGFNAKVAFLTVQKRHPIRFFQFDKRTGAVSNPLPGTVVDKDIVHPEWNEYYVNSHHALQGSSKPAQYKLVFNQIDSMTADKIEKMSYFLCYGFQRSYKPISCPTPARYAHLVAEKAAGILESARRNKTNWNPTKTEIDEIIRSHKDFEGKLTFQ